jgi:hypothetical protein
MEKKLLPAINVAKKKTANVAKRNAVRMYTSW